MERIRLLLIDDHILFRDGLSRLLALEPDLEVVAGCGTVAEALETVGRKIVDIVLLDYDLGEDHGSHFISSARRAGYTGKVLMVTAGMSAKESSTALHMGASGIFLKHNSPGTLAKAVRDAGASNALAIRSNCSACRTLVAAWDRRLLARSRRYPRSRSCTSAWALADSLASSGVIVIRVPLLRVRSQWNMRVGVPVSACSGRVGPPGE